MRQELGLGLGFGRGGGVLHKRGGHRFHLTLTWLCNHTSRAAASIMCTKLNPETPPIDLCCLLSRNAAYSAPSHTTNLRSALLLAV